MSEKEYNTNIVKKEKKSIFTTVARYGRDAGWLLLNKNQKAERIQYAKSLIKDLSKTHESIRYVAIGDRIGYPGVPYPKIIKLVEGMIKSGEIDAHIEDDIVVFQKEKITLKNLSNDIQELKEQGNKLEKTTSAIQAELREIREKIDQEINKEIPENIKKIIEKAENNQLEEKLKMLLNYLNQEKQEYLSKKNTPPKKLSIFISQINFLINQLEKIKNQLKPALESTLNLTFQKPELLFLAFCRPKLAETINSLKQHFLSKGIGKLNKKDFDDLSLTQKVSDNLAFIGDAVLDLGVLPNIYKSETDDANILSKRRANIVSNKNLARVCDNWKLYNYRLHKYNDRSEKSLSKDKIIHEKGTLVEAIIGTLYLESKLENIDKLLPFLENKQA